MLTTTVWRSPTERPDMKTRPTKRTLWEQLRNYVVDTTGVQIRAMTVSSTGSVQAAPSAAATTSFIVAPVEAPGKIVYWAEAPPGSTGFGSLKGFDIGEEGVEDVLKAEQVKDAVSGTDGCIGCHAATPDGKSVGMVMGPPMSNITNDWPKWSPHVTTANGKKYYWLTFSSKASGQPQLFVTGIIGSGSTLTMTPALYSWNQPTTEGNHTPSRDDWQISPIPIIY
jgi:hypothetical protein